MRDESTRLALRNESEASLLHGILEEDGVPHLIRSYHDRAYDGLWQMQEGWGYVETSARFAGGVRALLELLRKNKSSSEPASLEPGSSELGKEEDQAE